MRFGENLLKRVMFVEKIKHPRLLFCPTTIPGEGENNEPYYAKSIYQLSPVSNQTFTQFKHLLPDPIFQPLKKRIIFSPTPLFTLGIHNY
jgi:hypothetical protein